MSDGLPELVRRLGAADAPPSPTELADALWLAQWRPGGALAAPARQPAQPEAAPEGDSARDGLAPSAGPTEPEAPDDQDRSGNRDSIGRGLRTGVPPTPPAPKVPLSAVSGDPDGQPGTQPRGLPVRVPVANALPAQLPLQRALRPLQRYRPPLHTVPRELDEQQTAERAAETGIVTPVLRSGQHRAARLQLVMDDSSSMTPWREMCAELRQVCSGTGAFRDVKVHSLQHNADTGEPAVGPAGRSAKVLRDPTGHWITLLLSDCAGPLWRSGRMQRELHQWARSAPVAVIQPLPQRMWRRTHLPPQQGQLRRREGLGGQLEFRPATRRGTADATPVPVLSATEAAFGSWARLVSGSTGVAVNAAVGLVRSGHPPARTRHAQSMADPGALLETFRRGASPEAVQLARYLSAAPLALPVMQLVQRAMLPNTTPSELAEVLLSGLLVRQPELDGADGGPWYAFQQDVRERLLGELSSGDAVIVMKRASEYVEQHFGRRARNFPAMAAAYLSGTVEPGQDSGPGARTGHTPPGGVSVRAQPRPRGLQPFAEVSQDVLRRFLPRQQPAGGAAAALVPGSAPLPDAAPPDTGPPSGTVVPPDPPRVPSGHPAESGPGPADVDGAQRPVRDTETGEWTRTPAWFELFDRASTYRERYLRDGTVRDLDAEVGTCWELLESVPEEARLEVRGMLSQALLRRWAAGQRLQDLTDAYELARAGSVGMLEQDRQQRAFHVTGPLGDALRELAAEVQSAEHWTQLVSVVEGLDIRRPGTQLGRLLTAYELMRRADDAWEAVGEAAGAQVRTEHGVRQARANLDMADLAADMCGPEFADGHADVLAALDSADPADAYMRHLLAAVRLLEALDRDDPTVLELDSEAHLLLSQFYAEFHTDSRPLAAAEPDPELGRRYAQTAVQIMEAGAQLWHTRGDRGPQDWALHWLLTALARWGAVQRPVGPEDQRWLLDATEQAVRCAAESGNAEHQVTALRIQADVLLEHAETVGSPAAYEQAADALQRARRVLQDSGPHAPEYVELMALEGEMLMLNAERTGSEAVERRAVRLLREAVAETPPSALRASRLHHLGRALVARYARVRRPADRAEASTVFHDAARTPQARPRTVARAWAQAAQLALDSDPEAPEPPPYERALQAARLYQHAAEAAEDGGLLELASGQLSVRARLLERAAGPVAGAAAHRLVVRLWERHGQPDATPAQQARAELDRLTGAGGA